jgi:hypothetical protein
VIDEPISGCEAVTCAECPLDYTHEEDGSCCGVCTKITIIEEPERVDSCDNVKCA